nr:hypothetical protein [uncultured Roseovarius sp.]
MYAWNRRDWARLDQAAHLEMARTAPAEKLGDLARHYDWDLFPEPVLGWIMSQKGIDLASAIAAFFNGTPERFNHLHKRDVPETFQPAARTLDNICLRLNCGFYTTVPALPDVDTPRLAQWMASQQADRKRGVCGRWVLDENIIAPLLDGAPSALVDSAASGPRTARRRGMPRWLASGLRAATRLTPNSRD